MTQKILIVGANGKTGSRVERQLLAAGVETRGVSRSTNPSFDWTDSTTWQATLQGVTAAYLTYHPDLSVPEAEGHIKQFCDLAKNAGVKHVVLLSGRGEPGAANAEKALMTSGLAWNIVQASWFAQNFSEDFMLDSVISGQMVLPKGTAAEPFIDIDDIADVVVATLLEPGLQNRLFEVTGPRLLSFADCMKEISGRTHRPIEVMEVSMAEYCQGLRQQNLPEAFIELLAELFGNLFDGRNAFVSHGVEEALGRPARDFADYVKKTAETGVWQNLPRKEVR